MLFEKITQTENDMIFRYRVANAYSSDCYGCNTNYIPNDELLREWDNRKSTYLGQMFNGELILSKKVSYALSYDEMANQINDMLEGWGKFGREERNAQEFYRAWCNWIWSGNHGLADEVRNMVNYLMSDEYLISNIYDGESFEVPLPNGKVYKINKGAKIIRALSKIASAFNLPGFEDFRICHSQILNQKDVSGVLNISIHPLDYMTMSDNTYGWESCMSWENEGGYRQGTVEMMNSPSVVVAYLSGEEPFMIGNNEWNNKRWRQLFVVSRNIITSVKAYPYANPNLTQEALKWLKELAETQLNWTYEDIQPFNPEEPLSRDYLPDEANNFTFDFPTGYMYSDFGSTEHWACINDDIDPDTIFSGYRHYLVVKYGGVCQCMVCGQINADFADDGCLACCDCQDSVRCDCCGDRVSETWEIDGLELCESCWDNHVIRCPVCDRDRYDENMRTIYIIPRTTAEMMEKLRADYKAYHYYVSNLVFIDCEDTQFIYRKNQPQVWLCDNDRCFENWIEKYLKPKERPHQRLNQWSENSIYVYFDQLNEAGREEFAWEWDDMESFMNAMHNQNIIPTTPPEFI